jgi:hypothetical protein
MKFFIYFISIIFTLSLVGLFVLKKPNGQAWLTVDDFLPNRFQFDKKIEYISDKLKVTYESFTVSEGNKVGQGSGLKVYRWKDSNGNWSYSDKPKESADSEEVFLDPNDVVVLPEFKASINNLSNSSPPIKTEKTSPSPLTISPSKVLDLHNDAKNVQKLMDDREQSLSKAIKDSTG